MNCQKNIIKSGIKSTKGFDSEPLYNGKYLKTKTKSYEGKISPNFYNDRIRKKERSHCIFLLIILIDSVIKMGKNYFSQIFLEECKYIVKERKMTTYITDDLEIYSDDSGEENLKKTS